MRQVMHVHHQTVDTYLDSILVEGVDKSSEAKARQDVEQFAQQLEGVLDTQVVAPANETSSSTRAAVQDVLGQFLLPEVERQSAQLQGPTLFMTYSNDECVF